MSASMCCRAEARRAGLGLALFCAWPAPAMAHGFGERYDLPLPLSFYLFGAAATVAATFLLAALFAGRAQPARVQPRIDLLAAPAGRLIAHPAVVLALRLVALLLFALTIAAGFLGDPSPYRNLAPTAVWIVFWVGLALVSAFVGNLWAVINPWSTLFDTAEAGWRALGGKSLSLGCPYPAALGAWPACALLFAFAWIELVYPHPAVPSHLAAFALAYSLLTWVGMAAYGRAWLRQGEVFGVLFGLFARFAPLEIRGTRDGGRTLVLRPFGAGLSDGQDVTFSLAAFVLFALATVLYDGFLSTPEWSALAEALRARVPAAPAPIFPTLGLIVFWLVFLGAYLGACRLMAAASGAPAGELAPRFALSLVPIAIGYHVAHYLVFLLIQGQYAIPLLSDPFGFGWNLFGTAGYRVDIAIVGPRFAWYAALAAILAGHIAAVVLAHRAALALFGARRAAVRSQLPLTALMVVYTLVSLSILAQPVAEYRAANPPPAMAVRVPADALRFETGSGRIVAAAESGAALKLTYQVLGSAFHDGTRMTAADLLYAYGFAYRWSERDPHVEAATTALRRALAAVRIGKSDATSRSFRVADVAFVRELFEVDVYLSVAPLDADHAAALAPPFSAVPWHLLALMEDAVSRGLAAFSRADAERRGVPWLDLARSPALTRELAARVAAFERDGYRPEPLQTRVSAEDARRRWAALAAFHKEKGHFLVTNGPYALKQWDAGRAVLAAFRDLTYPLGVGSYDAYAVPRRGFVSEAEVSGGRVRLRAEIETVVKFQRSHRIERRPLRELAADVVRRAAPECRYLLLDRDGRVAAAGSVGPGEDLRFAIELSPTLPAGDYTLLALIAVNENAANAEVRRIPLSIGSR